MNCNRIILLNNILLLTGRWYENYLLLDIYAELCETELPVMQDMQLLSSLFHNC